MSNVNLNTNAGTVQDTTNSASTTTTAASAAEWQKMLLAALQQEEAQNSANAAGSVATPVAHKKHHHHASITALEDLMDKAVAQGILTADEGAKLKAILEKRKAQKADGTDANAAIFKILQAYMPAPTTIEDQTTQKPTSVDDLKTKMQAFEQKKLANLKTAVAAAQQANALTPDQLTTINSFISDQETFMSAMQKINAAGLSIQPSPAAV
jgi:polyhydroxyalkanoate synthesis regulator phasin